MTIEAGKLKQELIIEEVTETNTMGNVTQSWSEVYRIPCEFMAQSSREYFEAHKRNAEMTALFRIRYLSGIDPAKHRGLFTLEPDASPIEYQVFNLYPPKHDAGRRETLLEGREVV